MRLAIKYLVLVSALALSLMLAAHEGHAHHVMGTVSSVDASKIEVKDESGKLVTCQISADTKYMRGEELVSKPEIKVGERIMVEGAEKDGKIVAQVVRLSKATAPAHGM